MSDFNNVDVVTKANMDEKTVLQTNIERIQERIAAAARRAGRDPADITLVAVTKTVPAHRILAAWQLGLRNFGENRVQEAADKIPLVQTALTHTGATGPAPIHWHMIGHLQRNKVKQAIALFELIHSVDSVRLAREIDKRAAQAGQIMPVLLEVNIGREATKYGFMPEELPTAVAQMQELVHIQIQGLMTVAPLVADPEQVRPCFREMHQLRDTLAEQFPALNWQHLSMGMTDDFEVAIEEGATLVRLGRAIFGERQE